MSGTSLWVERVITPEETLERVRIRIDGGRIAELEGGTSPAPEDQVHEGATLLPGLVDLQVNGGDGGAFASEDPEEQRRATDYHVRAGTTSFLATVVTSPIDVLEAALERLSRIATPEGPVVGTHLEGPFLALEKAGAHSAAHLCQPSPEILERLLAAGSGALRMVTLAPELPGARDAVERIAGAGIIASAGHSVATLKEIREAIEWGVSFMTHVGNASDWPTRPVDEALGFRVSEPGMVGTFLIERRLRGSVILDGLHLHPELAAAVVRLRGPENVALVSDATHAAGLPPGRYHRGGLDTVVHDSGYATTGKGLAGSVAPLLRGVQNAVREAGLSLAEATRMATLTPAQVLGIEDRKGRIAAGADADFLLLDADLELRSVYRRGLRVAGPASSGR
ncbi:MAG: N-acetylglucosamine-6-phosphate deacetylase [Myxococcota bacterium]